MIQSLDYRGDNTVWAARGVSQSKAGGLLVY